MTSNTQSPHCSTTPFSRYRLDTTAETFLSCFASAGLGRIRVSTKKGVLGVRSSLSEFLLDEESDTILFPGAGLSFSRDLWVKTHSRWEESESGFEEGFDLEFSTQVAGVQLDGFFPAQESSEISPMTKSLGGDALSLEDLLDWRRTIQPRSVLCPKCEELGAWRRANADSNPFYALLRELVALRKTINVRMGDRHADLFIRFQPTFLDGSDGKITMGETEVGSFFALDLFYLHALSINRCEYEGECHSRLTLFDTHGEVTMTLEVDDPSLSDRWNQLCSVH